MPASPGDPGVGVVHLVEVGGRGGVFHHTLGVGRALRDAGVDVLVHTAADAEALDDGLPRCACMHWSRRPPRGVRQGITAIRFLVHTCRHLVRTGAPDDTFHIQGLFGNQLTAWLILRLSHRGRRVAFSPHNTFARSGRRIDERTIAWMCRRVGVVFVFSRSDEERLASIGVNAVFVDLVHHMPQPAPAVLTRWNERFGRRPVALLAGQVRADKRPDVFVRACRQAGVTPAVVGPSHDGEALLGDMGGVDDVVRVDGYLPLEEFVAAVMTCDVVVATHAVGSVSGPLAFAADLGVRTVAPSVGGLAELVTVEVQGDTSADFARAITVALSRPAPSPRCSQHSAEEHLEGYRRIGRECRASGPAGGPGDVSSGGGT
jgi:glycosyltransferase involved in cell wall biosynthesis